MSQTWIVFTIDDQQVYQIKYTGCTGQDVIDGYKTMIAGEYDRQEADIQVSFKDDLNKPEAQALKTREKITSIELVRDTLEMLVQKVNQN
jgi:hypothetical protein